MSRVRASWPLRSEHSGALLRLRRLVENRQSFVLCFLTYSDSAYRETVAGFLAELLDARLRVAIDCKVRVGTEELFGRLSDPTYVGPAQLSGLESWPDGLDDLLTRLNYRREAFAARCQRPLLIWIRERDLQTVATGAADLWAWRSGVFDFSLPAVPVRAEPHYVRTDPIAADRPARQQRLADLQRYLRARPSLKAADADLLVELGDLQASLGHPEDAEQSYSKALTAVSATDDRRRRAVVQGRIADTLVARGDLDEALRIRREEQIPVYERLGDERSSLPLRGVRSPIFCSCAGNWTRRCASGGKRRSRSTSALGMCVRACHYAGSRSPTFCSCAGNWTRRCASGGKRRSRSTSALAMCVRLPSPGVGSPTFCSCAGTWTRRCASGGKRRSRSTSALAMCVRLPSPGAGDRRHSAVARGPGRGAAHPEGGGDPCLRTPWGRTFACIARGKMADILRARGELDEALRIRREEQVPVYERLGDVRSLAIAGSDRRHSAVARGPGRGAAHPEGRGDPGVRAPWGRAFACHRPGQDRRHSAARGDLDEALRIRREEQIPVYERLGSCALACHNPGQDRRHPAVARGPGRGAAHPAGRGGPGVRTPWGRAFACHRPWQDRRHSAGARGPGRGAAHPEGRGGSRLRAPWGRAIACHRPWQDRRHSAGARGPGRGAAHPGGRCGWRRIRGWRESSAAPHRFITASPSI